MGLPRVSAQLSVLDLVLLSYFFASASHAELPSAPDEYERKSIALVPVVLVVDTCGTPVSSDQKLLFDAFKQIVINGRFYSFDLPPVVATNFASKIFKRKLDDSQLDAAVRSVIVPHMIEVLEVRKIVLAKSYRSEADRQSFIVTKAKDLGIDSQLLEKAYDCSFVGIPYITSYDPCQKDGSGSVSGGIVWYQLDLNGASVQASQLTTISAREDLICVESQPELRFDGFRDALSVRMRDLNSFQMSTQILAANGQTLKLSIGKQDGLSLDELYYIEEQVQGSDESPVKRHNRGWARISKLYDESDPGPARGEAKIVASGRRVHPGMSLVEIPRGRGYAGIDVFYLRYHVNEGRLQDRNRVYMRIPNGGWRQAVGIALDADVNIAKFVNSSQVFFSFRVGVGLSKLNAVFYDDHYRESDLGKMPTYAGILDLGLSKRLYSGPVGLVLGVR